MAPETDQDLKQQAKDVAVQAKDQVKELASQAKDQTVELAHQAQDQVATLVDQQKKQAAERLGSLAGALHEAAKNLEQKDTEGFGRYAHRAADQVDRASRYLREKDLQGLVRDTETCARRHPDLFLGGSLVAGVLLARFLKSSSRETEGGDSWRAGQTVGQRQGTGGRYDSRQGFPATPGRSTVQQSYPARTGGL
jgi:hypothetical protein